MRISVTQEQDEKTAEEMAAPPGVADMAAPPAVAEEEGDDIFELAKALAFAAVIALSIRSFFFEPFNIPSGSMLPTLLVGDYLFVEKYSYGYSKYSFPLDFVPIGPERLWFSSPERGDVAVFRKPSQPDIDYIKRIIGLPGDRIQVRSGILHVNGKPVSRDYKERVRDSENGIFSNYIRYEEKLPNGVSHSIYEISDRERYDNTRSYIVPEGYYFAMGDNRDGSLDSRSEDVGFVPRENLVGRAWFIFFSTTGITGECPLGEGNFAPMKQVVCQIAAFPSSVRYNRIFRRVRNL